MDMRTIAIVALVAAAHVSAQDAPKPQADYGAEVRYEDGVKIGEKFIKADIRKRLEDHHGAAWFKTGVPRKIQIESGKLAVEKNAERDAEHELEPWDCLYIVDFRSIMTQTNELWKLLFEKRYTPPGDENRPGGWKWSVGLDSTAKRSAQRCPPLTTYNGRRP